MLYGINMVDPGLVPQNVAIPLSMMPLEACLIGWSEGGGEWEGPQVL